MRAVRQEAEKLKTEEAKRAIITSGQGQTV